MKKAQSTLEYAVLVAIVVAALLSMQIYIKRGLQGGFRVSADNFGEQYAPKHTSSDISVRQESHTITNVTTIEVEDAASNKLVTTTDIATDYDRTTRSGTENIGEFESNLFE